MNTVVLLVIVFCIIITALTCYNIVIADKYIKVKKELRDLELRMNQPLFTVSGADEFQPVSVSEIMNMEKIGLKSCLHTSNMVVNYPELINDFDLYLETDKGMYKRDGNSNNVKRVDLEDIKATFELVWPDIDVNRECKILNGYVTFHDNILRTIPGIENLILYEGDILKVNLDHNVNFDGLLN